MLNSAAGGMVRIRLWPLAGNR